MREEVLHYIRERQLLKPGDRVAVAVSGGADSVALLRVLLELRDELGVVLFVAHFNHQLRGQESDADERFVAELAQQHDLPFFAGRADVRLHSADNKLGLEDAARKLRYRWLLECAGHQRLNAVATGHTFDDQAETVLMKFLRGAGTRGLSGIRPIVMMSNLPVVRPLLRTARADIEAFLAGLDQPWREDHSNFDTKLTRNRIRYKLLPLLERDYNSNLHEVLSDTAEVALAEELYWSELAAGLASRWHQKVRCLRLQESAGEGFWDCPIAVQRRTLKQFLEWHGIAVDFRHVEAVRLCAMGDGSTVSLSGGWQARRDGNWLALDAPTNAFEEPESTRAWQHLLTVPGTCHIPQARITLEAIVISADIAQLEAPGTLLRASAVGSRLTLRNWLPGDRFRPAHRASEEKLKRLFSEKKIPAQERQLFPVALSKDKQIVWVRGFPVAHDFRWTPGCGDAVRIDVLPAKPTATAT